MICYRKLTAAELSPELFGAFCRRQIVTKCWRRENGRWVVRDAPFLDDWSAADYRYLTRCLQNTLAGGGMVCGAFAEGALKGFVSVEGAPLGSRGQYRDMTSLHVSQELRGQGIGSALFREAAGFARRQGAEKLYISAHSAVESQAFYRAMGCVEAEEYSPAHTEKEPFDCQLEYRL